MLDFFFFNHCLLEAGRN